MPRTKRNAPLLCGMAVFIAVVSAKAQEQPLPRIDDITATFGNEAEAGTVFLKVLTHLFQQGNRKEFLLRDQIRPEWLPKSDRVQFVLTTEADATKVSECNLYWRVAKVERSGNVITIRFNQRCGGTTKDYRVERNGQEWQFALAGIGSGFVGRPEGCPCVP